jgi:hypothetical protein
MILIYRDSQIIDLEWIPRINFNDTIKICPDLSEFISSPAEKKIAFITQRLTGNIDHTSEYQKFEDKILKLSEVCQLVFTFEGELHNYHWNIWKHCHRPNIYWCVPGYVNNRDDINSNIMCWGDWFKTTAMLYKKLPDKLAELKPYDVKPKYFDALLGSPKPHRDFVFEYVNQQKLQDKIVMTYGGNWQDNQFYAKDYFIWEEGTVVKKPIVGTADWIEYCGHQAHLSQVIPIQVFNDTAYSIVAETDTDNTLSFFSEKTAKPILARRLFIAFSGYRFLQNLRKIGFKTFGNIIDESYDFQINDYKRYKMAFDQVKRLCVMDQAEVYRKICPIVEHNYELIMSRDWTAWTADQITERIALLTV